MQAYGDPPLGRLPSRHSQAHEYNRGYPTDQQAENYGNAVPASERLRPVSKENVRTAQNHLVLLKTKMRQRKTERTPRDDSAERRIVSEPLTQPNGVASASPSGAGHRGYLRGQEKIGQGRGLPAGADGRPPTPQMLYGTSPTGSSHDGRPRTPQMLHGTSPTGSSRGGAQPLVSGESRQGFGWDPPSHRDESWPMGGSAVSSGRGAGPEHSDKRSAAAASPYQPAEWAMPRAGQRQEDLYTPSARGVDPQNSSLSFNEDRHTPFPGGAKQAGAPSSQSSFAKSFQNASSPSGTRGGYGGVSALGAQSNGFDSGEQLPLEECRHCGRKFKPESLEVHVRICKKVFQQKRNRFNSAANRLGEFENADSLIANAKKIEQSVKAVSSSSGVDRPAKKSGKGMPKWKQESLAFRAAILAAKGANGDVEANDRAEAIQRKLQAANTGSNGLDSDMIKCPHCSRTFKKESAERHIPICLRTFGGKSGGGRLLKGGGRVASVTAASQSPSGGTAARRGAESPSPLNAYQADAGRKNSIGMGSPLNNGGRPMSAASPSGNASQRTSSGRPSASRLLTGSRAMVGQGQTGSAGRISPANAMRR